MSSQLKNNSHLQTITRPTCSKILECSVIAALHFITSSFSHSKSSLSFIFLTLVYRPRFPFGATWPCDSSMLLLSLPYEPSDESVPEAEPPSESPSEPVSESASKLLLFPFSLSSEPICSRRALQPVK